MSRLLRLAAAAAGALAVVLPPVAAAGDVSRAQFRALVDTAADNTAQLARLREVDSVDGRHVDIRRALTGASGEELRLRLRALRVPTDTAAAPTGARDHAERILGERRFNPAATPRPFRRLLEWLSAPVRVATKALRRLVEFLAGPLPGHESTLWTLLALLACSTAALVATRIARRRTTSAERARRQRRGAKLDPQRFERDADEAERRGDLELALRLRFRAGLIRLGLAEVIPLRDSLTSGEVRRRLQQPEFDVLAAAFDEIVYGRRSPAQGDVEQARAGWPRVLKAVGAG